MDGHPHRPQEGFKLDGNREEASHIDPRTAKRYALSETKPTYQLSGSKASMLDSYKQQIDQWLEEAPYSAVKILEKLKDQGYQGK